MPLAFGQLDGIQNQIADLELEETAILSNMEQTLNDMLQGSLDFTLGSSGYDEMDSQLREVQAKIVELQLQEKAILDELNAQVEAEKQRLFDLEQERIRNVQLYINNMSTHIAISLDSVCMLQHKYGFETQCPTYKDLWYIDNANPLTYGRWYNDTDNVLRRDSIYQPNIHADRGLVNILDPSPYVANAMPHIIIVSNLSSFVPHQPQFSWDSTYRQITVPHTFWINDLCNKAVISSELWNHTLPLVMYHLREGCSKQVENPSVPCGAMTYEQRLKHCNYNPKSLSPYNVTNIDFYEPFLQKDSMIYERMQVYESLKDCSTGWRVCTEVTIP